MLPFLFRHLKCILKELGWKSPTSKHVPSTKKFLDVFGYLFPSELHYLIIPEASWKRKPVTPWETSWIATWAGWKALICSDAPQSNSLMFVKMRVPKCPKMSYPHWTCPKRNTNERRRNCPSGHCRQVKPSLPPSQLSGGPPGPPGHDKGPSRIDEHGKPSYAMTMYLHSFQIVYTNMRIQYIWFSDPSQNGSCIPGWLVTLVTLVLFSWAL